MRANSWRYAATRCLPVLIVMSTTGLCGCKSLTEKYIALEVWKYEKLFGHLPPGFVPPGAMPAAPAMRPCGQGTPSQAPPCGGAGDRVVGGPMTGDDCGPCQGGVVEGAIPSGAIMSPGVPAGAGALPVGPGGSPGPSAGMPTPAGMSSVTSSRPVIISDEVVLP